MVPWAEIAAFLTLLVATVPEQAFPKPWDQLFPKPAEGVGRPLPEDFVMRGQIWSEPYFPSSWFVAAAIDDEERVLELPSMAVPRVDRILGLGSSLAEYNRWISYDSKSRTFS